MSDIIPKGAFVTVSTGCYSDYYVSGVFQALGDIDVRGLTDEWLAEHPEQRGEYSFNHMEFLAWVSRKGLLKDIPAFEWHLVDYGSHTEMTLEAPSSPAADLIGTKTV